MPQLILMIALRGKVTSLLVMSLLVTPRVDQRY